MIPHKIISVPTDPGLRVVALNQFFEIKESLQDFNFDYELGVPSTQLKTFTLANKALNVSLTMKLQLPEFLTITKGTGEFIMPPESEFVIEVAANNSKLKTYYPSTRNDLFSFKIDVPDVNGPIFVRNTVIPTIENFEPTTIFVPTVIPAPVQTPIPPVEEPVPAPPPTNDIPVFGGRHDAGGGGGRFFDDNSPAPL